MPELNIPPYRSPAWLEKPAPTFSEILQGAQQYTQLRTAQAELPYKLRALQQDQEMSELKQREYIRQRDQLLQAEEAAQGLSAVVEPLLKAGKPFEAITSLLSEGVKNPILFKSPQWQTMMKELQGAVTAETARKQIEETSKRSSLTNELGQLRIENEMERLRQGQERLGQGDVRLQQQGLRTESELIEKGQTIEPGPEGRPKIVQGPKPQTTANVTKLQDSLTSATTAIRQIGKLQPMVNANTFGPVAYVQRQLIDRGLANIPGFENLVNADRVEAGVVASGLRATTLRALRSDSNITDAERKIIEQDIPSPGKFLASPREAMIQLRAINNGIVERAIQAAHTLNQTLPDTFLRDLPDDLLLDLVRSHQLTPEEAQRWHQLKP